jgi:WD40 repeat protein
VETPGWLEECATTVAFSPAGRTLASGTGSGMIRIWDADVGRQISAWRGHSAGLKSLAFSPDGRKIASGGDESAVKIWDISKQASQVQPR